MINQNKSLTQKALAGVSFLRMHAEAMADDDDFFIAIMSEPHTIAANAIEQLVKENEKLRAQLVAFQKAANPAVAVDPAAPDSERTCHTTFVKGLRVCLRRAPSTRGTIDDTRFDKTLGHLAFVYFESPFEPDRWMRVKHLELVPHPDR
ncbi:hypothetical protein FPT84_13210 [Salmonella enterica]|uniref:Uncharacterized protein n=1 Tax=Salmonella enterica I TaxID=59201 RepID=A0A5U3FYR3_SALET|nr:hypothetical protein [Salmonella enterica]EBP4058985.1 hypothetical protein [Salmonella enterica subsp. enterica]EDI0746800.1 hypothetical protein [Salmonella enterica subsp. enterica serovar Kisarawe]AXD45554.1 hypothetical protein CHD70_26735 [Salmonella enterica]EAS5876543.1 hypothetical protein [Salmonella enterica]EAU6765064.1 hypothetical protein [Salmonella enterica]